MNVETTREGCCDADESYLKYAKATPTLSFKPYLVVICSSTIDLYARILALLWTEDDISLR
jgi:hypothetical protein